MFLRRVPPGISQKELIRALMPCGEVEAVRVLSEREPALKASLFSKQRSLRVQEARRRRYGKKSAFSSADVLCDPPALARLRSPGASAAGHNKHALRTAQAHLDQLLQRFPTHAFALFRTRDAARRAVTDAMRIFGVAVGGFACRVEPASEKRVLSISQAPAGVAPHAMVLMLNQALAEKDVSLRLVDQKWLDATTVTAGDVMVEFASHRDALEAEQALHGVQLEPGKPLLVTWAAADEWTNARPKFPSYF